MRSCRAASRPRRAASLLARWRTRRCVGLTIRRRRLTSTFGSPGAGSTTAVRSSTAVTQTRRPSTSASKSGRISSSSSIETLSSLTSSAPVLDGLSMFFRFEAMLICEIPDREQDQTRYEPRKQVRRDQVEQNPSSRPKPPPQFEEDACPDRGGDQNARNKYLVRDAQYSRQGGKHDPHARNVPPDDDGPRAPALDNLFGVDHPFVGDTDISAETLNKRPAVPPADGQVDGASQNGSAHEREIGHG